jgi:hypothetical protein
MDGSATIGRVAGAGSNLCTPQPAVVYGRHFLVELVRSLVHVALFVLLYQSRL